MTDFDFELIVISSSSPSSSQHNTIQQKQQQQQIDEKTGKKIMKAPDAIVDSEIDGIDLDHFLKFIRTDVPAALSLTNGSAGNVTQGEILMYIIDKNKKRLRDASIKMGIHDWESVFKLYDIDGNGILGYDEFLRIFRVDLRLTEKEMKETEARFVFEFIDADLSGGISADEFMLFLHSGRQERGFPIQNSSDGHLEGSPTIKSGGDAGAHQGKDGEIFDAHKEVSQGAIILIVDYVFLEIDTLFFTRQNPLLLFFLQFEKRQRQHKNKFVKSIIEKVRVKIRAYSYGSIGGQNFEKMFDTIDKSRDGLINEKELRMAIRRLLRVPPLELSDKDVHTFFVEIANKEVDGEGEKSMDKDGFLKFLSVGNPFDGADVSGNKDAWVHRDEEQILRENMRRIKNKINMNAMKFGGKDLNRVFVSMDSDGGGTISLNELCVGLRNVLRISEREISRSDCVSVFKALDRNNDGVLTLNEFVSFLQAEEEEI